MQHAGEECSTRREQDVFKERATAGKHNGGEGRATANQRERPVWNHTESIRAANRAKVARSEGRKRARSAERAMQDRCLRESEDR